ncbi:hypothetical protein R0381_002061 [Jeongeupia wiesaeckerbachi]|uniref:DUF7677 family protein n=1 Tax=Jeongeupia wiesaeckerbachi TaxID=3051218 RepID=UPI003D803CBE
MSKYMVNLPAERVPAGDYRAFVLLRAQGVPTVSRVIRQLSRYIFMHHGAYTTLEPTSRRRITYMKLSHSFSGALRTFAYFVASGTQNTLEGINYLELYGSDPSAIEQVFAIYANVLELDESGNVLNAKYAERRAADYLRSYFDPAFVVTPPYEEWETELYEPPPRKGLV